MPLRALPAGLVDRLRTGVVLNSIPQAVVELLANSIDAEAQHVTITLNAGALKFSVEDDGQGLSVDDLNTLGCRYSTSKIRSLGDLQNGVRTLGFRGEAVSSLFEIADVRVVTRARGTFVTLSKQAHGAGHCTRAGPSAVQLAHSGTSVSVHNFLFNQPVKQRQTAVNHRDTEASTVQAVFRTALPFTDVTVTLVHGLTGQVLLHLPKGRNISAVFSRLLPKPWPALPMLHAAGGAGYHASAVLGSVAEACPNQHHQYIYVNRRYVRSPPLATLLNDHFLRAYQRAGPHHPTLTRRYGMPTDAADATGAGIPSGSCGGAKAFPAFLVLLELPYADYDVTAEPDKSDIVFKQLPTVQQLLRSLVEQAWSASIRQDRDEAAGNELQQGGWGYREVAAAAELAGGRTTARAGNTVLARDTRCSHLVSQLDLSELQPPGLVTVTTARAEAAKTQGVVHGLLRLQAIGHGGSLGQSKAMSLAVLMTPERCSPAAVTGSRQLRAAEVDPEDLGPEGVRIGTEGADLPGLGFLPGLGSSSNTVVDYLPLRARGGDGDAALRGQPMIDRACASDEADTSDAYLHEYQSKSGVRPSGDGGTTAWFDCVAMESLYSPLRRASEFPGNDPAAAARIRLGSGGQLLGACPISLSGIEAAGQDAGWSGARDLQVGEALLPHDPYHDYDVPLDDSSIGVSPQSDTTLETGGMELTAQRRSLPVTGMPIATSIRGYASILHAFDGEGSYEEADVIPGMSPVTQMPMRQELGMELREDSTPSRAGCNVTWRCKERDVFIVSPLWSSSSEADEMQVPPGDCAQGSSPRSPYAARDWAGSDGIDACGGEWRSYSEEGRVGIYILAESAPLQPSMEGLRCGGDAEEAFWAEGLSPATLNVISRMRLNQRSAHIGKGTKGSRTPAAVPYEALPADSDCIQSNDNARPARTQASPADGAAEKTGPAFNTVSLPGLPTKGGAFGGFLAGLGDSPDEAAGKPGVHLQRRDAAPERQYGFGELDDLNGSIAGSGHGAPRPTQEAQNPGEPQGAATRETKQGQEALLPAVGANTPRALANATQERSAGQLGQLVTVGMALPTCNGSCEAAACEGDEGSLSPLARFLSFTGVSGDPTPTPPQPTVLAEANTTVAAAIRGSSTRAAVTKHGISGWRSGPQVSASQPAIVGGSTSLSTGPSGSLDMPSSTDSTKTAPMVDACSFRAVWTTATDKVVSPAVTTAGTVRSPTRYVQSAPPHEKKRSRVCNLARDGGLKQKSSGTGNGTESLAATVRTHGTAVPKPLGISGLADTLVDIQQLSKYALVAVAGAAAPQEASGPQALTSGAHRCPAVPPASATPNSASPNIGVAGCSLTFEACRPVCSFLGPRARAGLGSRQPLLAQPTPEVTQESHMKPTSRPAGGRSAAPSDVGKAGNTTPNSGGDLIGTSSIITGPQPAACGAPVDAATSSETYVQSRKNGIASFHGGVQMHDGHAVQHDAMSTLTLAASTHTCIEYGVDSSKLGIPAVTNQAELGTAVGGGISSAGAAAGISGILKKRSLNGACSTPKRVRFVLPAEGVVTATAVVAVMPGIETADEPVLSTLQKSGRDFGRAFATPAAEGPNKRQRLPHGQNSEYTVTSASSGAGSGTITAARVKDAVAVLSTQPLSADAKISSTQPRRAVTLHHTAYPGLLQPHLTVLSHCAPRLLSLEGDLLRLAAPGEHLVSAEVSRSCLAGPGVKVMQQVDCKFIPVIAAGGTLLIIDQHAAHERVRLEQLINQLRTCAAATVATGAAGSSRQDCINSHYLDRVSDGSSHVGVLGAAGVAKQIHSGSSGIAALEVGAEELLGVQPLPTPVSLKLASQEATTLTRYESVVAAWGWRLRHMHGASSNLGSRSGGDDPQQRLAFVAVNDRPMLLQHQQQQEQTADLQLVTGVEHERVLVCVPSVCGTPLTNPTDLRLYLQQLQEVGGADLLPPSVLRVLRSKACRTAIMFGDRLVPEMCSVLLTQLHGTQLWTQCAHGRPTVAPLVHLPTLRAVLDRRRAVTRLGPAASESNSGAGDLSATRRLTRASLQAAVSRGSTADGELVDERQRGIVT